MNAIIRYIRTGALPVKLTAFALFLGVLGGVQLAIAPSAHAAQDTCTWTGAISGDISDAGNWNGCDNGNLPEDGDDLYFPALGVTTYTVNWNLPVTPRHITVNDSNYNFGGTQIIMSGTLQVFGASSPTFQSTVIFQSTGQTGLNVQGGQPTFNAGITFNVTGGGFASIFTTNSTLTLPAMSGTTTELYIDGNAALPMKTFTLSSGSTLTVTGQVGLWNANIVCQSADCFGNVSNEVNVYSYTDGFYSQLTIDTPTFGYDVTLDHLSGTTSGERLHFAQNATMTGDVSVTSATIDPSVTIANGVTATISGNIDIAGPLWVEGADKNTSRLVLTGDATGGSYMDLAGITALFNGTNSFIGNYVRVQGDAVVGGSGAALNGISFQAAGATLAPGNSPGCLSTGFFTGITGGQFIVEINGTTACSGYDQLIATGSATLNNTDLVVNLTGGPYTVGTVFTIIDAGSVAGTFGGLADGATITVAGYTLRVNYTADAVTLTVVSVSTVPDGGTPGVPNTGLARSSTGLAVAAFALGVVLLVATKASSLRRIISRK